MIENRESTVAWAETERVTESGVRDKFGEVCVETVLLRVREVGAFPDVSIWAREGVARFGEESESIRSYFEERAGEWARDALYGFDKSMVATVCKELVRSAIMNVGEVRETGGVNGIVVAMIIFYGKCE